MTRAAGDVALLAVGVSLPRYRLSGATLAQVWGGVARRDERTVANHDEDALTLGVTAAADALAQVPGTVDGIFFASATSPYHEKLHAAVVATALNLDRAVRAVDLGASSRAAAMAVHAAADALRSRSRQRILVVLSDCRVAAPGSEGEARMGDGAVALLFGRAPETAPLAWLEATSGVTEDFPDQWRRESRRYPEGADARFVQTLGYERLGREVVGALLASAGLPLSAVAQFAVAAPDERSCRGIERAIGAEAEHCAGHALLTGAGDTGVPAAGLALAAALERARPDERIVSLCFGGGVEAMLWRVDEGIAAVHRTHPLTRELHWKRPLEHYGRFLQAQALLGERPVPFSSPILLWREQRHNLSLITHRCRRCGAVEFPPGRVCARCRARDEMEDFALARRGRVFTFTHDHLVPTPDPPTTMAIIDLEGGGRFYGQLTDCPPSAVRIGMSGELVLRRLHEGAGLHNYFWKLRPLPPPAP